VVSATAITFSVVLGRGDGLGESDEVARRDPGLKFFHVHMKAFAQGIHNF